MKRDTPFYCSQQIFHAAKIWSTQFYQCGLRPPELFFIELHAELQKKLSEEISCLGEGIGQAEAAALMILRDHLEQQLLSIFQKNEEFDIGLCFDELLKNFDLDAEKIQSLLKKYSYLGSLIKDTFGHLRKQCRAAYSGYLENQHQYLTQMYKNSEFRIAEEDVEDCSSCPTSDQKQLEENIKPKKIHSFILEQVNKADNINEEIKKILNDLPDKMKSEIVSELKLELDEKEIDNNILNIKNEIDTIDIIEKAKTVKELLEKRIKEPENFYSNIEEVVEKFNSNDGSGGRDSKPEISKNKKFSHIIIRTKTREVLGRSLHRINFLLTAQENVKVSKVYKEQLTSSQHFRQFIHEAAASASKVMPKTSPPNLFNTFQPSSSSINELTSSSTSTAKTTHSSTTPLSIHQLSYRLLRPCKEIKGREIKEVEDSEGNNTIIVTLSTQLNDYLTQFNRQWFKNGDKKAIVDTLNHDLNKIAIEGNTISESQFCNIMELIDNADRANSRLSGYKLSRVLNEMRQTLYEKVSPSQFKNNKQHGELVSTLQSTAHAKAIAEYNKVHVVKVLKKEWRYQIEKSGLNSDPNANLVLGIDTSTITLSQLEDLKDLEDLNKNELLFIPDPRDGDSLVNEGLKPIQQSSWWRRWDKAWAVFRTSQSAFFFLEERRKKAYDTQIPGEGWSNVRTSENHSIRFFSSTPTPPPEKSKTNGDQGQVAASNFFIMK